MALQGEERQNLQNPLCVLDGLYCEEESFEEDLLESVDLDLSDKSDENAKKETFFPSVMCECDFLWDDNELISLIHKEKETNLCFNNLISDGFLVLARKEAVDWVLRVREQYGFTTLTTVLAVSYFDRFISSLRFQKDKPWMGQLAAVACLSLAAKMDEIQAPLLLDLQVEEAKYIFEPKTIQRMELLVLSTLQWRMNLVTPISFFDHIVRRFGSKTHLPWEFMWRCEILLLSVVSDAKFMSYLPSVLATAIMICVIKEVEPCNQVEYQSQLMSLLNVSEKKVNECCKLILDSSVSYHDPTKSNKRKNQSVPGSPNGVFDVSFSSDSSNDSWPVVASVSSSPEPRLKRSRIQVQQMRLPPINLPYLFELLS